MVEQRGLRDEPIHEILIDFTHARPRRASPGWVAKGVRMKTGNVNPAVQSISASALQAEITGPDPPIVIDVRRDQAFKEATQMFSGALRRDPDGVASWAQSVPAAGSFVAYCVHGGEVSQHVAKVLSERGIAARYLEGGIAAWSVAGAALDAKPRGAATRWITRERPKIDRIACPWLIARFVDPGAEFLYVPTPEVPSVAREKDAVPYDIPDVHFSHEGERCSFDAFLKHYRLRAPALRQLALIVRGADTARLELAPQAPGLAAISLGLSRNFADDHEMLAQGMVLYDALYTWCKEGQDERHTWNPQLYRTKAVEAA
jgi:rhodanese-related sulfurtransferase